MNLLHNDRMTLMENALNASVLRQKTTASNIANADTPGYKAQKTVFQHALDEEQTKLSARRTSDYHVHFSEHSNGQAYVSESRGTTYNHNGNNVDIDKEMSSMAENQIYYHSLIERMNSQFNSIRTAIGKGR